MVNADDIERAEGVTGVSFLGFFLMGRLGMGVVCGPSVKHLDRFWLQSILILCAIIIEDTMSKIILLFFLGDVKSVARFSGRIDERVGREPVC